MSDQTPKPHLSHQQTQEQRRGASAWKAIEAVNPQIGKKYGALTRGFAAMIQRDGLGPALAFLIAKGDKHHMELYRQLSSWTLAEFSVFVPSRAQGDAPPELLPWLIQQTSMTYRRATTETQAYLQWLKRFVEAKGWKEEEPAHG